MFRSQPQVAHTITIGCFFVPVVDVHTRPTPFSGGAPERLERVVVWSRCPCVS